MVSFGFALQLSGISSGRLKVQKRSANNVGVTL